MEDEGENEFVSEVVNEIVKVAITKNLGSSQYHKDKVILCQNKLLFLIFGIVIFRRGAGASWK